MTTVQVVESVAASAKAVWDILSDFGGIKVGGPIEAFEIEGEGVGAVRTITMNGGKVIERLDVHDADALTFAYSITNEDNPLPVSNYSATVKITANGDNACTVDWSGTFEPKGADEETASKVVQGIYKGGIRGAQKTLGA
ncbi:MAG: SRPBCC family protein [Pseudomonadota bacterium]